MLAVSKTIWGPPIGAALTAYDETGAIAVVVPCKPKSVARWMLRGVTTADRRRCQRALGDEEAK